MRPTASVTAGVLLGVTLTACSDPVRPSARPTASNTNPNATVASPAAAFLVARRDLGTLGGRQSRAVGNNDHGVVVGWSLNAAGQKRGFKWTAGGGMHALATLAPGKACQANHVNENGVVVGYCLNAAGQKRAVLWSATGAIRALPLLARGVSGEATDVNDAGTVVGIGGVRLTDGTVTTHAFKWSAASGLTDLDGRFARDECGEVPMSKAEHINRFGVAVGIAHADCGDHQDVGQFLVTWSASNQVQWWFDEMNGSGINDAGVVVGINYNEGPYGFRWRPSEQLYTDLFSVACTCSGFSTNAVAINNADLTVGASDYTVSFPIHRRAAVWTATNAAQDLGTLAGGTDSQANDINNKNQVVGWSNKTGGAIHATLWTLTAQ
jgi:probable HAF family extracellular repeat protein